MSEEEAPQIAPKCVYLRANAYYVSSMAADAFSGEHELPHCWCNRTLRELGPDGESADLPACSDPGRACYRGTRGE